MCKPPYTEKIAIDDVDVERNPMEVHSVRRPVSRTLDFTDFAMNYFELEPGEPFSGGLHTHHGQVEVFYVREGVATFEIRGSQSDSDGTRDDGGCDETSEVAVREGEGIRFAPGDFQTGYNDSDEQVVGFAFGAPDARHDWDQNESLVYCRDCGDETGHGLELADEGSFRLTRAECSNSFIQGEAALAKRSPIGACERSSTDVRWPVVHMLTSTFSAV